MSPEGVGGEADEVGEVVVELDDDGVSGVAGVDAYDDAEDGEGVRGGWATLVRICWRVCLSWGVAEGGGGVELLVCLNIGIGLVL